MQVGLRRDYVRELALHVLDILVYWLGFCPLYIYMYSFMSREVYVFVFAASFVCPDTCAESFVCCVGLPVWLGLGWGTMVHVMLIVYTTW